jgi:hypothetical protein
MFKELRPVFNFAAGGEFLTPKLKLAPMGEVIALG